VPAEPIQGKVQISAPKTQPEMGDVETGNVEMLHVTMGIATSPNFHKEYDKLNR